MSKADRCIPFFFLTFTIKRMRKLLYVVSPPQTVPRHRSALYFFIPSVCSNAQEDSGLVLYVMLPPLKS